MMSKKIFARSLPALALAIAALMSPTLQAQSADKYVVIEPAQPSDTTGKTEVLEFFAYSCPHCARFEPMVAKWEQTLPDNVVVKHVPVAFNASMADLQKLYYTLESLGKLDLHDDVFRAIHGENKRIYDQKAITGWIAEQGVDPKQFEATFNSFGVNSKVQRANELAKLYKIDGTPSLAIGGKYVTSPAMTGTYQGALDQANELLATLAK